jgi:hypothetical protein
MKTKRRAPPPVRNLFHDHPLLRKGAVHEKSGKARRRHAKVHLSREWDCPKAA